MSLTIIENGHIAGSLSTVPILSVNDVTASRALSTIYTNNTGKTLIITISIRHYSGNEAANKAYTDLFTIPQSGGSPVHMLSGIYQNFPTNSGVYSTPTLLVKPGDQYILGEVLAGNLASNTIIYWIESY